MTGLIREQDTDALRRQLVDLGDGLQAQCHELHRVPTPERCERLACSLEGARRMVMEYCGRLVNEGKADER